MKMVPLDIVDGSYKDEDLSFSAQDTVNYLPTSAEQGGTRTPTMLRTPPGLKPLVAVGVTENEEAGFSLAGPIRNTYNAEGRFFAVAGNTLYQITTAGISIPLGTVPGVGRVSFSHNQITNGNEILVNNGNAGYIYNTVTQFFQRITDTSYPGGLQAVFINNRFVQIEPSRRYLFNSDLADGLSYNALDRFTSETSPDLVMSIQSIGNQLAVFSSTTTEWFEDTGANPQPFRSTGIVADKGSAGPFCTAKMDNQLFFLADDGVFYRYQGYNPVRISTKPIEQAIRGKNWFNCFTTVWEDSGYAVCYWTFPDGQTWGYDASTGKWHRRESYGFNRWRLNSLTYWQNKWVGGDFQRGHLWELDWDYQLEGDQEFECIRAAGDISNNQNRVIHERLELLMNTGMVETVPLSFGEQPIGPTITGDAPSLNGVGAYTYTYTTTPGDAPIARTVLLPGSSTLSTFGLSWNQTTATVSGTVTRGGVVTLLLRVYDTNGLYDDHEDTIELGVGYVWTDTAELTSVVHATTQPLTIGGDRSSGNDGMGGKFRLQRGLWIQNGRLTQDERIFLFNFGASVTWDELQDSTDPLAVSIRGKVTSWWELDPATVTVDEKGSNSLTAVDGAGTPVTLPTVNGVRGSLDPCIEIDRTVTGVNGNRLITTDNPTQAATNEMAMLIWMYREVNSNSTGISKWNAVNASGMAYKLGSVGGLSAPNNMAMQTRGSGIDASSAITSDNPGQRIPLNAWVMCYGERNPDTSLTYVEARSLTFQAV